ncbi:MAG TPA: DUF4397 domain-containing protein [Patescibacteria group bacterium]|nr:DUF4397 domain-containing protein [Patescibacteria group bacterium]
MNLIPSSCFKNSFLAPVIILFAFMLLLMAGCADENPDLVNPRGGNDSINVRFVNLASDGLPRTFALEGIAGLPVAYGQTSALQRSGSDSGSVTVSQSGTVNFQTGNKIIFGKNTVQTIVALPSGDSAVGRIVALSTPYVQPTNTHNAFVRFFNAVYDTTRTYSIRIGCPNGEMFGAQMQFGSAGLLAELPPGETVISVLSREVGFMSENETIIGTFKFTVESRRSYTIIAFKKAGQPEILLLDELDNSTQSIKAATRVTENTVEIRTINFSQSPVDISNQTKKTIASGITSGFVGRYESIITCDATGADSLSIFASGQSAASGRIITSLDILKKYSIIVLDSGAAQANYTILVPPVKNFSGPVGTAMIRVVNATTQHRNITVSLGAQNDSSASGYRSGGTIAASLLKGRSSEAVSVPAGSTPFTVFTSAQPAQLLFAAASSLEAGQEYLLIVKNTSYGNVQAVLLKSTEQLQNVELMPNGSFVQIVHAVPGAEQLHVSIGTSLSSGRIFYRGSLATVIAEGTTEVRAGNVTKNITAHADSSLLLVVAGTAEVPEIMVFSKSNRPVQAGTLERRVIHAAKELGTFSVFANDTVPWAERLAENVSYGQASEFQWINTERRLSLIFWNPETRDIYLRTENINFPLGKRYSLILAGAKNKSGYTVITQQEF